MRLVVIGAPGAGKGTQAKLLAKRFNAPHVSTGDLLREHIEQDDAVGRRVRELMDAGSLVPDDIVIEQIQPFVESGSFIFDGFPRTIRQAELLDGMLAARGTPLDKVVYVMINDDVIINRMAGRQTCTNCGSIYNTESNPPRHGGVCDSCGGALVVREDDSPVVVRRRLDNYHNLTEPIIDHYRSMGLVFEISGLGDIGDITDAIAKELPKR